VAEPVQHAEIGQDAAAGRDVVDDGLPVRLGGRGCLCLRRTRLAGQDGGGDGCDRHE
jgi:hypothetical protein